MNEIERLIRDLASDDREVRGMAAEELSYLGEEAAPAAVPLVRLVGEVEEVREYAVSALEDMGPPSKNDLPELCELLSGNEDAGYWAATLIGRLEDDAAAAVPALIAALRDAPLIVQQRAAWALMQIGPAAASALPALEAAADNDDKRLSFLARNAIEGIHGNAP